MKLKPQIKTREKTKDDAETLLVELFLIDRGLDSPISLIMELPDFF